MFIKVKLMNISCNPFCRLYVSNEHCATQLNRTSVTMFLIVKLVGSDNSNQGGGGFNDPSIIRLQSLEPQKASCYFFFFLYTYAVILTKLPFNKVHMFNVVAMTMKKKKQIIIQI